MPHRWIILLALLALLLAGCSGAGVSFQCHADPTLWHNEYCEVRSHHPYRSSSVSAYIVRPNGEIVPLYPYESSSVFAPLISIVGAAAP